MPFIVLTIISSALSTLKNIFLSRKENRAAYIVIFIDALIFATIMKKLSSGEGFLYAVTYALGKTLGAIFGSAIDKKMALGILEVDISVNHFDKMTGIADELRDLGYAVETTKVYGYGGKERYKINVIILRKEIPILKDILDKYGYNKPTMVIRDVSKISGKITVNSTDDI